MLPTLEMPTIPEYLKHKPEYRTAWIEYERKLDEWRKTLQTQIGAAASVTTRVIQGGTGGGGGGEQAAGGAASEVDLKGLSLMEWLWA